MSCTLHLKNVVERTTQLAHVKECLHIWLAIWLGLNTPSRHPIHILLPCQGASIYCTTLERLLYHHHKSLLGKRYLFGTEVDFKELKHWCPRCPTRGSFLPRSFAHLAESHITALSTTTQCFERGATTYCFRYCTVLSLCLKDWKSGGSCQRKVP